jgi:hypothetical protein
MSAFIAGMEVTSSLCASKSSGLQMRPRAVHACVQLESRAEVTHPPVSVTGGGRGGGGDGGDGITMLSHGAS